MKTKIVVIENLAIVVAHVVAVTSPQRIPGQESVFFVVHFANVKPHIFTFNGSRAKQADEMYQRLIAALED